MEVVAGGNVAACEVDGNHGIAGHRATGVEEHCRASHVASDRYIWIARVRYSY